MKNWLAEDYKQHTINISRYQTAKAANDDAGMQEAREENRRLDAIIEARGNIYRRIYSKYESAQKRGNEFIDLDDVIWDKDVEELVNALRRFGIKKFVFSSSWSSAVDTAWLFQKNGCKLEGLVEINGRNQSYDSDEYDKAHGYLFSVN